MSPHARATRILLPMTLPDRIRQARKLSDLTQAALASNVGVGSSAVAQWELPDGTSPTVDNLIKVALVTDVSFEWLATARGPIRADGSLMSDANTLPHATNNAEDRLLALFRRLRPRKREALIRWMEEFL